MILLKVTKEMTKPLLSEIKEVVRKGLTKNKYEVVLHKDVLRLRIVLYKRFGDDSVIPVKETGKFIKMAEKAYIEKNLVGFSEKFPELIINYLEKTIVDPDYKDSSKNLHIKVQNLQGGILFFGDELTSLDIDVVSSSLLPFYGTDPIRRVLTIYSDRKYLTLNLHKFILVYPQQNKNFDANLLKVARESGLALETVMQILGQYCESLSKVLYELNKELELLKKGDV